MQVGLAQCVNKGMQRDYSMDKASQEFAYENKNIRITTTGDNSFLSVTNEKSTENITLIFNDGSELVDGFTVLGSTTIGDRIIIFGTSNHSQKDVEDSDFIYRIDTIDVDNYEAFVETLYCGNLGFRITNPIECITSYEADNVQKVYWVDGINQPRVINVCNTYKSPYNFDFVPSVSEGVDVSIEKEHNGTGNFKSGVIQYFVTFYKKFGSETNAVYQSPLYYISPSDRGGKVDETQTCSFKIQITPTSNEFDYVRIYSIIRTSLNITSSYIVADLELKGKGETIQFIDTNNGTPIAPTDVMFLGGNTIVASTIEQKDNTLFLGNITEKKSSFDLQSFKDKIQSLKTDTSRNFTNKEEEKHLPDDILKFKWKVIGHQDEELNSQYNYYSQLNKNSSEIKGFKFREVYRFGLQLQTDTKEWTQTIWLDDLVCDKYPKTEDSFEDNESTREDYFLVNPKDLNESTHFLCLPYIWFNPERVFEELYLKDFANYRLVMAQASDSDRSIVCQGYLNPTLYNTRLGYINSWNIKPINEDNKHWENTLYLGKDNDGNYVPTPKTELDLSLYKEDAEDNELEYKGAHAKKFEYSDGWNLQSFTTTYICKYTSLGVAQSYLKLDITMSHTTLGDTNVVCFLHDEDSNVTSAVFETSLYRYKTYLDSKARALTKTFNSHVSDGAEYPNIKNYGPLYDYICETIKAVRIENIDRNDLIYNGENEFPYIGSRKEAVDSNYKIVTSTVRRDYNASYKETINNKRGNHYFINSELFTLNTPNINKIQTVVNNSDLKFRIVGKTDLKKNVSSYKIQANETVEGNNKDVALDFNFSGNYDKDKKTYGLQSYPLWSSYTRIADEGKPAVNDPDRYNWTYLWNSTDLSKDSKYNELKKPAIKEKTFGNVFYGNTTYNDSLGKSILWESPSKLRTLKSITTDKTAIESKLYYRDLEDTMLPESNKLYYMDKPYSSNFQPYDYKDTKSLIATWNFQTINIKYNSLDHIVIKFDNYNNHIVSLPGYENLDISFVDGNLIDLIGDTVYPLGSKEYTPYVFQDAYENEENYFKTRFTKLLVNSERYRYNGKLVFKDGDIVFYFYKTGDVFGTSEKSLPPFKVGIYKEKWEDGLFPNSFWFVNPYDIPGKDSLFNNEIYPKLKNEPITFNFKHSDLGEGLWEVSDKYEFKVAEWEEFMPDGEGAYGEVLVQGFIPVKYSPYIENTLDVKTDNSIWIGELYKDFNDYEPYGGTSENAIELNTFIPISEVTKLEQPCNGLEGDTYFQRWDSLRTYPKADETQGIVDVVSLMLETHDNLDGRSDINRGRTDVHNIRPENINVMNDVYSQSNNYVTSNVLDEKLEDSTHPTLYTWSLSKQTLADVDNWTAINLARSLKLDGDKGELTKIKRWNNQLLAFQEKGLAIINFNQQTTISTSDGVPVEIANSGRVTGHYYVSSTQGCKNKWSIVDSPYGLYFIDSYSKSINAFGSEGIKSLSTINLFQDWVVKNEKTLIWTPVNNGGFKSFYDPINKEVYFVNNEHALCYNELLNQFTSFYDYQNLNSLFAVNGHIYGVKDGKFHLMFEGRDYCNLFDSQVDYSMTYKINKDPFIDKTWTNIEYRADVFDSGNISEDNSKKITTETFDKLKVWNEYQSGTIDLFPKAKVKFRIWRMDIPRDGNGRGIDRIRNPWIMLKLSKDSNTDKRMEFHDLVVKYLQ